MIVAFMYDFDKTLCDKDMQEYGFIPSIGYKASDFWRETTALSLENNLDKTLSYMYMMLQKANKKKIDVTKDFLMKQGESIAFFNGVKEWFYNINKYGKTLDLEIEHYIISSGLKEIILGSEIAHEFKKIYACEFHYNEQKIADWPAQNVNYTMKTQFLFRINKGVLDSNDDYALNSFTKDVDRRIPYENMIYFGDGITDVPCMRLVKSNGGTSIAIYQRNKKTISTKLVSEGRVDFAFDADYSINGELFKAIKLVLEKIALNSKIKKINDEQKNIF